MSPDTPNTMCITKRVHTLSPTAMTRTTVTDEDKGKKVVNANGDVIGQVSGTRGGTAFVDPDPGVTEQIMSKLGWSDIDDDDYRLDESKIETITDDEIRLQRDL